MIEGVIQATGTPIIARKVLGKRGTKVIVQGIVDTGCDGFLVHKPLGPGLTEAVYEEARERGMMLEGINFVRQKDVKK